MRAKIVKLGGSLGLKIPKRFADSLGVSEGAAVAMTLENGAIAIRPVPAAPLSTLDDLLAQVTDDNRHSEVPTGDPVGREAW